MRKRDGTYTYFLPDVAYHVTKWERGYRRAINVQGADHHSTVTRVRVGLRLGVAILLRGARTTQTTLHIRNASNLHASVHN